MLSSLLLISRVFIQLLTNYPFDEMIPNLNEEIEAINLIYWQLK
jgi:hypothetical protein